jgi:transposase
VLLVGIDWGDQVHVYCLMDEAGRTLSTGTIEHTADGLESFMNAVRARVQSPSDVLVAIETAHGPLVGALLDDGFTSYAMNPKAVERHRERFRMSGAKSDVRDAWTLATMLRTDRHLYRPIVPDSEVAQELRALTRDRAELVRTRTMLSNQLTTCLKTYFPEFLTFFTDPDRRWPWRCSMPTLRGTTSGPPPSGSWRLSCVASTVRGAGSAQARSAKGCSALGFTLPPR